MSNGYVSLKEIPHSPDLEAAMLGGLLLDPRYVTDARAVLSSPEECFILSHRLVLTAILAVAERGETVDILTVGDELASMGQFESVGGDVFLASLMAACPDPVRTPDYALKVSEKAFSRRLMAVADTIRGIGRDPKLSMREKRAKAESELESIGGAGTDRSVVSMSELINEYYDYVDSTVGMVDGYTGQPIGFRDFDEITDGLQVESLNYLAARPGMGKTALMLCGALAVAKAGGKVYFWSGEMSRQQLRERLLAVETGVPSQRLRRGMRPNGMSQSEWLSVVKKTNDMINLNIFIDDAEDMTPGLLKAHAESVARRRGGLDLICVDYIGLMEPGVKKENRDKELGYISRKLKRSVAKIAPVWCAAQLSRAVENREDKRPQMRDLRDSGNLEQDADTVTFIYRDVVYNEATEHPNRADLILAKNRHGSPGVVSLHFERSLTKFTDSRTMRVDLSGLNS